MTKKYEIDIMQVEKANTQEKNDHFYLAQNFDKTKSDRITAKTQWSFFIRKDQERSTKDEHGSSDGTNHKIFNF